MEPGSDGRQAINVESASLWALQEGVPLQGSHRSTHPLWLRQLAAVVIAILGAHPMIRGADPVATRAGQDALVEGEYPWYDALRDDVVRGKTLWRDGMLPPRPREDRRD